MKSKGSSFGVWAFSIGLLVALVVGIIAGFVSIGATTVGTLSIILIILGLIVGALNITEKEVSNFIIAAIGLTLGSMVLTTLGNVLAANAVTAVLGKMIVTAFSLFTTLVAGIVFIPALKAVYRLSKD